MTSRLDPGSLSTLYAEHIAMLKDAYAAALEQAGFDAVVIHAGTAQKLHSVDDRYWPHRPTPAFAHWLPLPWPDAALIIEPGKRPRLYHVAVDDYWESEAQPESDHFFSAFEVSAVKDAAKVGAELPPGRVAFLGDDRERARSFGLKDEAMNPASLTRVLDQVRVRKSAYERLCMAGASRRAAIGHQAVVDAFLQRDDVSELELHLLYLRATEQDDWQTPYKNIVAMGENAAVLHHVRYGLQARSDATSLLVDAGATCLGYASDITRTVVKGEGSGLFAELIHGIEELQKAVIARITPGLNYEELHDESHRLLAPVLRELGIAKGSDGELVERGITRAFFPHGLGHSLGIQVHDVGCRLRQPRPANPFLRNTSDITVGQVFTIEPGCYFIDGLLEPVRQGPDSALVDWEVVDALRPFGGVRIEDNIAVVDTGTVNLTRDNWRAAP